LPECEPDWDEDGVELREKRGGRCFGEAQSVVLKKHAAGGKRGEFQPLAELAAGGAHERAILPEEQERRRDGESRSQQHGGDKSAAASRG